MGTKDENVRIIVVVLASITLQFGCATTPLKASKLGEYDQLELELDRMDTRLVELRKRRVAIFESLRSNWSAMLNDDRLLGCHLDSDDIRWTVYGARGLVQSKYQLTKTQAKAPAGCFVHFNERRAR